MKKIELLDEIERMIDEESNITVIQSEHFNEDLVKALWNIKAMVKELDEYDEEQTKEKFKPFSVEELVKIYDSLQTIIRDNSEILKIGIPSILDEFIEYLRIIHEEIENKEKGS